MNVNNLAKGFTLTSTKAQSFCNGCALAKSTRISSSDTSQSEHRQTFKELKAKQGEESKSSTDKTPSDDQLRASISKARHLATPKLTKFGMDLKGPFPVR